MIIERKSIVSGKVTQRYLSITQEEYDRWRGGELIQNVFPHMSDYDREWLMTGMTNEEQDEMFKDLDS